MDDSLGIETLQLAQRKGTVTSVLHDAVLCTKLLELLEHPLAGEEDHGPVVSLVRDGPVDVPELFLGLLFGTRFGGDLPVCHHDLTLTGYVTHLHRFPVKSAFNKRVTRSGSFH